MFPDQMRSFNKRFINRITRHFVNLSRGPFAVIRHVGRRSGKTYETPIFVFPVEDGFVIALTYGPGVDWYRNVLATGSCTLLWHRKVYALGKPEPATVSTVNVVALRPGIGLLHKHRVPGACKRLFGHLPGQVCGSQFVPICLRGRGQDCIQNSEDDHRLPGSRCWQEAAQFGEQ
ncbi:MAG: hypothetical protein IMW89_15410 [Ktedonobacteraceae bacterium]|nr:hypothetical protein [Ktedonobacteraceae bacterium]